MTDELESILREVRAHLLWEADHGHAGIAYEPPSTPRPGTRPAASPMATASAASPAARPVPVPPSAEGRSNIPDEAMAIIRGLKGTSKPGSRAASSPGVFAAPPPSPEVPSSPVADAVSPLPPRPTGGDKARLTVLAKEISSCTRCGLSAGRTQTVFARGAVDAEILFVGEGPGQNEDEQGLPFVGAAGQLLDKMIEAMGLPKDGVYICNVVKCRPPENRTPLPDEAAQCMPYLREQIGIVGPRLIVALGRCAAENLGCAMPGRSWRGIWGTFEGTPVMPTYHPAYLLRSPEMKRPVWEDLQKVMQRLRA